MKNIHILQTDKLSRLFKDDFGKLFYSINVDQEQNHFHPQYAYITNDEEIKEGDWFFNGEHVLLCSRVTDIIIDSEGQWSNIETSKKIILTTDFRLSPDVQKIDNKFLEWFVKNPSCEEVKVEDVVKYFNIDELRERQLRGLKHIYSEKQGYKIIIPSEQEESIASEEKGNVWIALSDKRPTTELNGEKVLLYRIMNPSQSSMAISIIDTFLVKNCDPNEIWWMELPLPPNTKS